MELKLIAAALGLLFLLFVSLKSLADPKNAASGRR
jgi:hypothetical protein